MGNFIKKNRLALLGVVLVVVIVTAFAYQMRSKLKSAPGGTPEQTNKSSADTPADNTYVPTLEKIDDSKSNANSADQPDSPTPPTTNDDSGNSANSFDASLPENKNATSTYEPGGNFDQKE